MLDEAFRKRVAALAESEDALLDDAACARIMERVAVEGPALVHSARRRRVAVLALGPALAAAAAFAVYQVDHRIDQPVVAQKSPIAVTSETRACVGRGTPAGADRGFVAGEAGSRELFLGEVARARAEPGADARLEQATACATHIALAKGTVVVHAKDLGGGELLVRTRMADVVVHGTLFAVTQSADALTVEVVEGRVGVRDRGGEHFVGAGERLLVSNVGLGQGTLPRERIAALRTAVGAPVILGLDSLQAAGDAPEAPRAATRVAAGSGSAPVVAEPHGEVAPEAVLLGESKEARAPSAPPSDPLAEAERARKEGDFARARELYKSVASTSGPLAEAAWVALARMELGLGHAAAALDATRQRRERFGQGTLAPEALWIDVRAYRQSGDLARARELASELVQRWPSSPQARAAQRWVGEQ